MSEKNIVRLTLNSVQIWQTTHHRPANAAEHTVKPIKLSNVFWSAAVLNDGNNGWQSVAQPPVPLPSKSFKQIKPVVVTLTFIFDALAFNRRGVQRDVYVGKDGLIKDTVA